MVLQAGISINKSLIQLAGTYCDSYRITKDMDFYAKWEKVAGGDNDSNTGDGTDPDTKTGASTADTDTDEKLGNSTSDAGQDKKADTSVEKSGSTQIGVAGAETQKELVILTGRTSPIYLFAAVEMFGVLLAALSIREGKRSSEK